MFCSLFSQLPAATLLLLLAATAGAQDISGGARFLNPVGDGSTFYYKDTINVQYESKYENPKLWLFCRPQEDTILTKYRSIVAPNSATVPVTLDFADGSLSCWFNLRSDGEIYGINGNQWSFRNVTRSQAAQASSLAPATSTSPAAVTMMVAAASETATTSTAPAVSASTMSSAKSTTTTTMTTSGVESTRASTSAASTSSGAGSATSAAPTPGENTKVATSPEATPLTTTIDPADHPTTSLSPAAIAGIAIGATAGGLTLIALLVLLARLRALRQRHKHSSSSRMPSAAELPADNNGDGDSSSPPPGYHRESARRSLSYWSDWGAATVSNTLANPLYAREASGGHNGPSGGESYISPVSAGATGTGMTLPHVQGQQLQQQVSPMSSSAAYMQNSYFPAVREKELLA